LLNFLSNDKYKAIDRQCKVQVWEEISQESACQGNGKKVKIKGKNKVSIEI
jgi:hypothetical protein